MEESKRVTRKQAEAVLALVEKKYAAWLKTFKFVPGEGFDFDALVDVPDTARPHVREWDTGHGIQLAIAWESGPAEWASHPLGEGYTDPEFGFRVEGVQGMPKGICAEPYYSFVLVLTPEV